MCKAKCDVKSWDSRKWYAKVEHISTYFYYSLLCRPKWLLETSAMTHTPHITIVHAARKLIRRLNLCILLHRLHHGLDWSPSAWLPALRFPQDYPTSRQLWVPSKAQTFWPGLLRDLWQVAVDLGVHHMGLPVDFQSTCMIWIICRELMTSSFASHLREVWTCR